MKSKLVSLFILYITILLTGTLFAQTSDCPPCTKDQPASPGKACCGREEYDPETHECCGDKIVEKGKCCRNGGNPTEYDPSKECCESSGVLPKDTISNLDNCPNRVANGKPPSFNGCSAPIPVAEIFFGTSFTDACNAHDICYSTCNNKKSVCDSNFNTAMAAHCSSTYPLPLRLINPKAGEEYEKCTTAQILYYAAVANANPAGYYIPAQKDVCQCCK